MTGFKFKPLVAVLAMMSLASVPMIVMADASAPQYRAKAKAKAHRVVKRRRAAVRSVRHNAPKMNQVAQAPAPVYEAPPAPVAQVYTPAPPVYTPPPPPPPPAPSVPIMAPKAGGGSALLGILGLTAVIAGIAAASGDSKSP
jgi:hypothetical protein